MKHMMAFKTSMGTWYPITTTPLMRRVISRSMAHYRTGVCTHPETLRELSKFFDVEERYHMYDVYPILMEEEEMQHLYRVLLFYYEYFMDYVLSASFSTRPLDEKKYYHDIVSAINHLFLLIERRKCISDEDKFIIEEF